MDFSKLKKRTLFTDYIAAEEICACAVNDGISPVNVGAYLYRAGIIQGRREINDRMDKMGVTLTRVCAENKALRQKLAETQKADVKKMEERG